jgi:hypothetical protein
MKRIKSLRNKEECYRSYCGGAVSCVPGLIYLGSKSAKPLTSSDGKSGACKAALYDGTGIAGRGFLGGEMGVESENVVSPEGLV